MVKRDADFKINTVKNILNRVGRLNQKIIEALLGTERENENTIANVIYDHMRQTNQKIDNKKYIKAVLEKIHHNPQVVDLKACSQVEEILTQLDLTCFFGCNNVVIDLSFNNFSRSLVLSTR
mgnify:CR=1 FL=1